ncbi:hypothetical protein IV203_034687 [Nitzschia inconspicua]|uniref:Uncharacterized protein n=1 Tax=Nitzschia inconspicua TaxID=303405 RepID=A0A9K3LD93_9STRA|nr:hypothetical protein IV203_034687 [Nitzschia inconspicua]
MNYSTQQQQQQQSQQTDDPYENPKKPESFTFGVTAERQEEPLREEKLYSEDDEWQPSAMMLCLLAWIVIIVAGGVAVGIYFANDRRGKNRSTVGPSMAPSLMPSMELLVCNICGEEDNGLVVTNGVTFVDIPGLGGLSCRQLEERGQNRRIPNEICAEQVQIPSVQNTCGCMVPPTESPTAAAANATDSAPNFVCPICGGLDSGITNPNGVLEFPGTGESVTCQEVQNRASSGQISPNVCFDGSLTAAVNLNCLCAFQCNLCGPVESVTNTNGTITVAGITRTCGELIELARQGQITEQQCEALQPLASDPCQCVFTDSVL